jgi:hypothetical protein
MKNILITLLFVCFATPLLGQDIDLGLSGDASSLLNIPAPRGNTPARGAAPAARGAAPNRGVSNTPAVDRLVRLRQLLAQSNNPLSAEQETALNALMNAEIPAMRRTLQNRLADLQRATGAAPGTPSMDDLTPEIIRLNDQLFGKIAEAPVLNEAQRAIVKKIYKDQVKSRGGFDSIKMAMDDSGVPFSAEQVSQIQPLFDQQNDARVKLIKEAQGQPDKAKLDQLQRDTLARVFKLLTTPQRTALLSMPKP